MSVIKHFSNFLTIVSIVVCVTEDNMKQKELELLEKEKDDLLNKIHVAIDDSVNLLKKDNNTQSAQGVNYMLELKQKLPFVNETDKEKVESMEENSDSELENRRKMTNLRSQKKIERSLSQRNRKTTLGKEFDIKRVLFGKHMPAEKIKQLMESRVQMQKKLDRWLLERELEKARIRERHLARKKLMEAGMLEKCPRFGIGKKKKKYRRAGGDRNNSSDCEYTGGKKRVRRKRRYPCCRKCCKKSYMGCL